MDSLCFRPLSGSYISQSQTTIRHVAVVLVSVPYRGATFLNNEEIQLIKNHEKFPSPIGELHFSIQKYRFGSFDDPRFRPLSGSYISQYHPRNPMFCLGQIGGLRGKSNFIEMQPFWKVKNSHKSSI